MEQPSGVSVRWHPPNPCWNQAWKCLMRSKQAKRTLSKSETRSGDFLKGMQVRSTTGAETPLRQQPILPRHGQGCHLHHSGSHGACRQSSTIQNQLLTSPKGLHKKSSDDQLLDPGRPWDFPGSLVFCPGATHQAGEELFAEEVISSAPGSATLPLIHQMGKGSSDLTCNVHQCLE